MGAPPSRLGDADQQLVQRLAGTVFLIRVIAAVLAYVSNVLFARWMGTFEFGVFVYVWTWVLLIGQALDLGLATAAQRFIPEYRERGLIDLLRGYISHSRWLAVGIAIGDRGRCAPAWCGCSSRYLDHYTVIPLYIACIALPAYALANVQDGISRSYDWVALGIVPTYIVRQLLLTVLMGAAWLGGLPLDAVTAMVLSAAAIWLPALGQMLVLNRRLAKRIEPGPKAHNVRLWIATALPILMAESFYLLLTHTDLLMLQQFRSPEDVAVYYAAVKTLALVAFIYFSIAATTAHRVSRLSRRRRPRRPRATSCARRSAGRSGRRWRRPSLLLAFGKPILCAVRPAVHRRLSPDVHSRRRPAGARRDRPDGALPQRDRRAAHLRADLWRRVRDQYRALLRADPAARRGRRRDRDLGRAGRRDHRAGRGC